MIWLYIANIAGLDPDDTSVLAKLSPEQAKKAACGRYPKERARTVGAELLLKAGLRELAPHLTQPITYHTNGYGKPFLEGTPLHFNLSHSGDMVACAISDEPVGVDIEQEVEIETEIAKRYFCTCEYENIQAAPDPRRRFFEYWVLKESYMKAVGLGFSMPPEEFCIRRTEEKIALVQNGVVLPFAFFLTQEGEYPIAVCCQNHKEEGLYVALRHLSLYDLLKEERA